MAYFFVDSILLEHDQKQLYYNFFKEKLVLGLEGGVNSLEIGPLLYPEE